MGATSRERYAVVSCHVERPLDDAVWARFSTLQAARPGGFAIAALLRPADPAHGEDEAVWVERAHEAAAHGPLGHHTHWTAPDHARPSPGSGAGAQTEPEAAPPAPTREPDPTEPAALRAIAAGGLVTQWHKATGARVAAEGRRLRELGLSPTLFCGGGWYTDESVAEACAELGYVDCTARATRPPYLVAGEPWATSAGPAVVELPSGRELRAIPTTHSLGDLARALCARELPGLVHAYFHDTDLLDGRRRSLLHVSLRVLARRAAATDLDSLAAHAFAAAPRVAWTDVTRL